MVVLREYPPHRARVELRLLSGEGWNAERRKVDALAVEHAEDVVVGHHEKRRRIGKRRVLRIPARIGVAVRRDDRQVLDTGVEAARHGARPRIGRKQPIVVDQT